MEYPKLYQFRLYALAKYEPQPIIKLLEKSKSVEEFKKLLHSISKKRYFTNTGDIHSYVFVCEV